MDDIQTAEDFYAKLKEVQNSTCQFISKESAIEFATDFAKYHLEIAQNEIIKHAILGKIGAFGTYWKISDLVIDKDSVRNAYPLTNIK